MKLTINRKALAEALAELAPLTGKNKAFHIFDNFKFVTKGDKMRVQASDGEITIRKYIDIDNHEEDGEFLADGARLNAFVNKCKGDNLVFDIKDSLLTIKHSKGQVEFSTLPAEDFIEPTQAEEATEVIVPAMEFVRIMNAAKNFVATDALRPQLCVVHTIAKDCAITFCATDTRQMFVDKISVPSLHAESEFGVIATVIPMVIKACKGADNIVIKVSDKQVTYRIGATTIFTLQPKGKYPDFNRVIPKEHSLEAICDKSELRDSIFRSMLFVEESNMMKVKVSLVAMDLCVNNLTEVMKSIETMQCTSNGEITFGVNASIFSSCVSACDDNNVQIEMSEPSKPIVVKDNANPSRTILCMPMTLK